MCLVVLFASLVDFVDLLFVFTHRRFVWLLECFGLATRSSILLVRRSALVKLLREHNHGVLALAPALLPKGIFKESRCLWRSYILNCTKDLSNRQAASPNDFPFPLTTARPRVSKIPSAVYF